MEIKDVETKDGLVFVNEYFAANPHMVLGQNRISGNVDDEGRRINSNGMRARAFRRRCRIGIRRRAAIVPPASGKSARPALRHPGAAIRGDTLRRSILQRAKLLAQAEGGIITNRRLDGELERYQ